MDGLDRIFAPRAVGVVGASPKEEALSRRFTASLARHGFPGTIAPINPKYEEIDGNRCFPTLAAAAADGVLLDTAVLSVNADAIPAALEDCAAAGVAGAIIFSSGFAETGDEGLAAQQRIVEYARANGVRILGPNSPGFWNFHASTCCLALGVGYRETAVLGGVGLLAQSGGVGGLICERGQDIGLGFAKLVSFGNESDIGAGELFRWLAADELVRVVAAYLEGVRDARELVEGFEAVTAAGKPLVILKPASTESVARASAAHTGVLATPDDVFDAVLHKTGATRVHSVEELIDVALVLDKLPPLRHRRVGLLSGSGGAAVLSAQAADRAGLELPLPDGTTVERLAEIMPAFASFGNPADLTGKFVTDVDLFSRALGIYNEDLNYETFVVIQTVHPPALADRLAANMIEFARTGARKPVCLWIAGEMSARARASLREEGFVVFEDADRCMRALALAVRDGHTAAPLSWPELEAVGDEWPAGQVPDDSALELLAAHGIPVAPMRTCVSGAEAAAALSELGGPVAVKAIGLMHKAAAGGLVLGVLTGEQAEAAHARVVAAGGDGARSLVQKHAPRGHEVIVGVRRDPEFGPVAVVGLGGSGAEHFGRAARCLLPLGAGDAERMLRDSGLWAMLEELRPSAPGDAVAVIEHLAWLAGGLGDRLEAIEVNPLIVHADEPGATAVDALVLLD